MATHNDQAWISQKTVSRIAVTFFNALLRCWLREFRDHSFTVMQAISASQVIFSCRWLPLRRPIGRSLIPSKPHAPAPGATPHPVPQSSRATRRLAHGCHVCRVGSPGDVATPTFTVGILTGAFATPTFTVGILTGAFVIPNECEGSYLVVCPLPYIGKMLRLRCYENPVDLSFRLEFDWYGRQHAGGCQSQLAHGYSRMGSRCHMSVKGALAG
jgi:hypothetical protein